MRNFGLVWASQPLVGCVNPFLPFNSVQIHKSNELFIYLNFIETYKAINSRAICINRMQHTEMEWQGDSRWVEFEYSNEFNLPFYQTGCPGEKCDTHMCEGRWRMNGRMVEWWAGTNIIIINEFIYRKNVWIVINLSYENNRNTHFERNDE